MTVSGDRPRRGPTSEVEAWTDMLSGLVERHPRLWIALGNWESRLLKDELSGLAIDRPIYVTGLARSGSTILLELLARHPDLATHRYRDFPPVLTPWLWNWFVDRAATREHISKERAHKDRIEVTPESPEAFEEVVWMAFFPGLHDPDRSSALDATAENPAFEAFLADHIRKMLHVRGARRYLAKANYNVTRLPYLLKLFPDARFVAPIRDPIWHIASLVKQHALFCREQARDPRMLRHMRRAGHFEFGLDRRTINVGESAEADAVRRLWAGGEDVRGWAKHWSLVYGHLRRQLEADPEMRKATLVVRYGDLCARPEEMFQRVLEHCALSPKDLPSIAGATIRPPTYYRPRFTAEERQAIREATAETARAFGYADEWEERIAVSG